MDEKRINQAKQNVQSYLSDSLLKKISFDRNIFERFEQNAVESLTVANNLFENSISYLWTIVASYYSMFYIANAFLYKKGYKAQHKIVHKVVTDALIVFSKDELEAKFLEEYEEEKDKALSIAENLLDSFEFERAKRSTFQYEMGSDLKKAKAETSLKRAKEFVGVFREIMNK